VLEPHRLSRERLVRDLEGRRLGTREDRERVGLDLDVARREVGVLLAAALGDDAGDADAEFVAQLSREREGGGALIGLESLLIRLVTPLSETHLLV